MAEAPFRGPYVSMKYSAALRKMHKLPQAKGMPASTGEIQWTSLRALQPNQKSLLRIESVFDHSCAEVTFVTTYPIGTPKQPI